MDNLLKEIARKFPDEFFLDENVRLSYSFDTSFYYSIPKAVFIPRERDKLIDVVSLLIEKGIPVTPRGRGTGRSGGSVPHPESVVVSVERLKNKIEFKREDEILYVEPGFTIDEINEFLKNYVYFYPPDPASSDVASVGGTVATNAGGPRAFKHGVTINYVNGIEVLLPDTRFIKIGGVLKKDKLFYSLKEIFVGSEGTLGLITGIYLKVKKIPPFILNFLIKFDEKISMLECADYVIGFNSSSLCEIMEWEGKFLLWGEFEGFYENVLKDLSELKKFLRNFKDYEFVLAENEKERKEILSMRRKYSSMQWRLTGRKKGIDVTVPVSKIRLFFDFIDKIEKRDKILIIPYGHFGDGNIHTSIIFKKKEEKKAEKIKKEICEFVIEIGGTVTGEHGFGVKYIEYAKKFKDKYDLMLKIKKAIDPHDLMNPGKIKGELNFKKYSPGEKDNLCILCALCNLNSMGYRKHMREDKATRGEIFISKIKGRNFLREENVSSLKVCPLEYKGEKF